MRWHLQPHCLGALVPQFVNGAAHAPTFRETSASLAHAFKQHTNVTKCFVQRRQGQAAVSSGGDQCSRAALPGFATLSPLSVRRCKNLPSVWRQVSLPLLHQLLCPSPYPICYTSLNLGEFQLPAKLQPAQFNLPPTNRQPTCSAHPTCLASTCRPARVDLDLTGQGSTRS